MVRPAGNVDQRWARVEDGVGEGAGGPRCSTGGAECRLFRRTRRRSRAAVWCCRQPSTGRPSPKPCPALPRNLWVGAWGDKAGGWIARDFQHGFLHGGDQPLNRLGALAILVMLAEGANLVRGPHRKADQRRCVSLRAGLAAFLASSRARLSRSSRMTTSLGTMRPAAMSASLSARTSSHSAGTEAGVGALSIVTEWALRGRYSTPTCGKMRHRHLTEGDHADSGRNPVGRADAVGQIEGRSRMDTIHEVGSGNVFANLGFPNSEQELGRAKLTV
jgi:hypothetical protein